MHTKDLSKGFNTQSWLINHEMHGNHKSINLPISKLFNDNILQVVITEPLYVLDLVIKICIREI